MTEDQEDIEASLRVLFGTAAGERFLVPTYGLDMHELLFEPMSTTMRTFLQGSNQDRDPDLTSRGSTCSRSRCAIPTEADGTLLILVEYAVRATNSRFNLVYPFYWHDATEVSVPSRGL